MKPITIHEFRKLVGEASAVVTAHTPHCPGIPVAREVALSIAEDAVRYGQTMTVNVFYLTPQPSILLGSEGGRRLVQ